MCEEATLVPAPIIHKMNQFYGKKLPTQMHIGAEYFLSELNFLTSHHSSDNQIEGLEKIGSLQLIKTNLPKCVKALF